MKGLMCAGRIVRFKYDHHPDTKWEHKLLITLAVDEGGKQPDLYSWAAWQDKALKYKDMFTMNEYVLIRGRKLRKGNWDNYNITGMQKISAPEDQPPIPDNLLVALAGSDKESAKRKIKDETPLKEEDLNRLDEEFV